MFAAVDGRRHKIGDPLCWAEWGGKNVGVDTEQQKLS